MSKKETIEEFLARGGKINVLPENEGKKTERLQEERTVKVSAQFDYDRMSLGDGEFYFGETRVKKKAPVEKVDDVKFSQLVEASSLPSHIVESLKKAINKDGN